MMLTNCGQWLTFVSGVYAKKNGKEFSATFKPDGGAVNVHFGTKGGLREILYCGFGFVLTRRELFDTIKSKCDLFACNQRFGRPMWPWFRPDTYSRW